MTIYREISDNVILLAQEIPRRKVNFEMIYSCGGGWFEKPKDRGKKHLLEHCIVSRTSKMGFEHFKDYCFKENIEINAYTSISTLGLESSGHTSDFYKMFDVLFEMFVEPTFDQVDLDREKEIVLKEISERSGDPAYRLHYDTMKQIFEEGSASNFEVLGEASRVAETTLDDFSRLHLQNLAQGNLIITVSGGELDLQYIDTTIKKYLAKNNEKARLIKNNKKNKISFKPPNKLVNFQRKSIIHPLGHEHVELTLYIPCEVSYNNQGELVIFEYLFLRYGGVLYDRLRDELGLIYGLHGVFQNDIQSLVINLSCEIPDIKRIIQEAESVFSDFDKNFNRDKFLQFKDILRKKVEITMDMLGADVKFTYRMLRNYGVPESYEEYEKRINAVDEESFKKVYNNIAENIDRMKVVAVSKNEDLKIVF
jgi:predicted Zn-dependent peptidase